MQMFKNLLAALLMVVFVAALIWAGSARAQSLDQFQGLVCKTPEGVRSVFKLHEQKTEDSLDTLLAEIKNVNEAEGEKDCAFRTVMEMDQEVKLTFHWRSADFDVKRIEIRTDCGEKSCIVEDGYVAAENKDTPA